MNDEGTSVIVQMLRSLDTSIAALRVEITANYVPRPEIEARFAESGRDRSELNLKVQSLSAAMEAAARQRVIDRRWVITTAVGIVAAVAAIIALLQGAT